MIDWSKFEVKLDHEPTWEDTWSNDIVVVYCEQLYRIILRGLTNEPVYDISQDGVCSYDEYINNPHWKIETIYRDVFESMPSWCLTY